MIKNNIELKKINLGFEIDVGAPLPTVLSNDYNLFLLFHKGKQEDNEMMFVTFINKIALKFSNIPSHSDIVGHPYSKYGLNEIDSSLFEVKNSDWIKELKRINSFTNDSHTTIDLSNFKHYIFLFHDSTFECIAKSFEIKELKGKYKEDILSKAIKELEK